MSDGDCHNPVHGNAHPRFSQSDTHCHYCGGPKWRWRGGDAMPRVRLLCEAIAAYERGRAGVWADLARPLFAPRESLLDVDCGEDDEDPGF